MDLWRRFRKLFVRVPPVSVEALVKAAEEGDAGNVLVLLASDRAHQYLNASDRGTALLLAAQYGHTAVAEALLMAGGDSVIERRAVASAISKAAAERHTAIVDLLADDYPELFNSLHAAESLRRAAKVGHSDVIRALVGGGTPPDLRVNGYPTPLTYAACKDVACVYVLLRAGANTRELDEQGRTALHYAASADEHACVHLLVAAGADVNAKDFHGLTAADLAQNDLRRFLLSKAKDPPL